MSKKYFEHQPGSLEINKIELISRKGKVDDITELFEEIQINEEINNFVTTGILKIMDTVSIKEFLPIIGGEEIRLSFRTNDKFEWFDGSYKIIKIGEESRVFEGKGHRFLILYFASEKMIVNYQQQFSKSYKKELISDIIADIWANQLGGGPIEIDATKNLINFIIPYWNPFKTIQYLGQKGISATYNDSAFLLYQDKIKHYWVPISHLLKKPEMKRSIVLHKVDDKDKTVRPGHFVGDAKSFDFIHGIDIIEDMKKGVNGSTIFTFDYSLKHFMKRSINFHGYYDTDAWNIGEWTLHEKNEIWKESTVGEFNGYITDKITEKLIYPNVIDEQSRNILRNRNRYSSLGNYGLIINKTGDSDITAGKVLLVKYMSRDETKIWHDRLYGNYLVRGVKHILNQSMGYYQTLHLIKDSFFADDHAITKKIGAKINPGPPRTV